MPSSLLPMLMEGMQGRDRLSVLDVGSGAQCTVDFFAQFNARIHFVDLLSCELFNAPPEDLDPASAARWFSRYLELPADATFDICLFWDALHRVNLVGLQGLSRALRPHVDGQTLGYGFGTLYAQTLDDNNYGIHDESHLAVRPCEANGQIHTHSQRELGENFGCMMIQRATLLREGRLELLLGLG